MKMTAFIERIKQNIRMHFAHFYLIENTACSYKDLFLTFRWKKKFTVNCEKQTKLLDGRNVDFVTVVSVEYCDGYIVRTSWTVVPGILLEWSRRASTWAVTSIIMFGRLHPVPYLDAKILHITWTDTSGLLLGRLYRAYFFNGYIGSTS
jgi:hypothetical protein